MTIHRCSNHPYFLTFITMIPIDCKITKKFPYTCDKHCDGYVQIYNAIEYGYISWHVDMYPSFAIQISSMISSTMPPYGHLWCHWPEFFNRWASATYLQHNTRVLILNATVPMLGKSLSLYLYYLMLIYAVRCHLPKSLELLWSSQAGKINNNYYLTIIQHVTYKFK